MQGKQPTFSSGAVWPKWWRKMSWHRKYKRAMLSKVSYNTRLLLLRILVISWNFHDDVIQWIHFPRCWPFARGINRTRWISHTKASDLELWCVFFYLRLNLRSIKQSWGWWFKKLSRPLWGHCNDMAVFLWDTSQRPATWPSSAILPFYSLLIQTKMPKLIMMINYNNNNHNDNDSIIIMITIIIIIMVMIIIIMIMMIIIK